MGKGVNTRFNTNKQRKWRILAISLNRHTKKTVVSATVQPMSGMNSKCLWQMALKWTKNCEWTKLISCKQTMSLQPSGKHYFKKQITEFSRFNNNMLQDILCYVSLPRISDSKGTGCLIHLFRVHLMMLSSCSGYTEQINIFCHALRYGYTQWNNVKNIHECVKNGCI